MSPSKRFKPVQRVAQSREQKAAKALGKSQREVHEQESRLDELKGYHREYLERFQGASAAGISVAQLQEYRAFLGKLERAIQEQEQRLQAIRQACSGHRDTWHDQHQRTQALGKVMERYQATERRQQDSREQKEQDDRSQHHGRKT